MAKFEDRIRFNWGYHDAVQCVQEGWDISGRCFAGELKPCVTPKQVIAHHFDKVYAHGWAAGYRDAKQQQAANTSEFAWNEYRSGTGYYQLLHS
jgi:hypothetical protein